MAETQQEQEDNFPLSGMGRSGTRTAGQAGKLIVQAGARAGTALLTTPAGWVIIGIVIVIVITFVIVFSFGPSLSSTETINPTVMPIQTITPTPGP